MRTRSQNESEEDSSSHISEEDYEDHDDADSLPECCECGEQSEELEIHKGDFWCKNCIENDKKPENGYLRLKKEPQKATEASSWKKGLFILLAFAVVPIVSWYFADQIILLTEFKTGVRSSVLSNCSDLRALMKEVKSNFASQERDTWFNFFSGISGVLRPDPVGSTTFLMLHEANARQTADRLAREIGRLAASCLGGNLLLLDGSMLLKDKSQHQLFLQKYQKKVEESKVLYVSEFQRLPSEIAKEFHFFCDSYSPLVPQTVFIFSLQVDKLPSGDDISGSAEDELKRIWGSKLQSNIILPLITRITANVVRIFE